MSAYTLTDLGPGVALDVNESGCVCGRHDTMERDAGGWYWDTVKRVIIRGHNQDGLQFTARTATEIHDASGAVLGDLMFESMNPNSIKRFAWAPGTELLAIVGDGSAPLSTRVTNAGLTVGAKDGHAITIGTGPGLPVHDLNFQVQAPGWILVAANSINKKGQICGGGVLNGQTRAFLLTPVANRVSKIEDYAGFYIEGHGGHTVRILASDTEWGGTWKELAQVMARSDRQLWVDTSAPRRRNRDYKIEAVQ